MGVSDVQASARAVRRPGERATERPHRAWLGPAALVAALTAVGAVLRVLVAHQSVFADELSTYWIVAHRSLGGVVSIVRTDAEITPPLSFAATWLTTRLGLTPELLRLPALVAGVATIPLVFLVGVRTVGRRAAVVAAALTTFAPFMVYYSAEARGYGLMMALVLLSTLALLLAAQTGRVGWWALYAVASCAAVYTHYTSVFVLAVQVAWVWWAHPAARRPVVLANGAALVAFLPWLGGLRGDLDSPTTKILSDLQALSPAYVRTALAHWSIGYPYALSNTAIGSIPGRIALALIGAGLLLAVGGVAWRIAGEGRRPRVSAGVVLVVALALAAPVGEALASALGSNVFGVRNLASSWPALALAAAALLTAAGRRLGAVAAALVVAALAIGAVKMLGPDLRRPDYDGAARIIDARAAPRDVVVDGGSVTPAGMPGALVPAFDRPHRVFYLGRETVRYDPFRILAGRPPAAETVGRAVRAAHGGRLFVLIAHGAPLSQQAVAAIPPSYARVATWTARGLVPLELLTYKRRP